MERHHELWRWVWAIAPGAMPRPFLALWGRGGAKSTNAEMAAIALGALAGPDGAPLRPYGLYVSATQDQADKHVATIAGMLDTPQMRRHYPALARRKVNQYGYSEGWNVNRLRTAAGWTIDAIGLDKAVRGLRVDEHRPGFIIFDDIDGRHDGPAVTARKIATLTESILPAGANDVAILFVQNLIIPDGIAARMADGRADFLLDRIVSGPHPAVEGLLVEQRDTPEGGRRWAIAAGRATWAGQPLEKCEQQINLWGLTAFLREAQHEVAEVAGGMFDHLAFRRLAYADIPDLVLAVTWLDPAVTATDGSDSCGIVTLGLTEDGWLIVVYASEEIMTPEAAIRRAILSAIEWGSVHVGIETNQGGDLWGGAYARVAEDLRRTHPGLYAPPLEMDKASASDGSKAGRAATMLVDYELGRFRHFDQIAAIIERALKRFPKVKPFDLVDALYWAWLDITGQREARRGDKDRARRAITPMIGGVRLA